MKIFISSVISGFEAERAAAREAIEGLDHVPFMAEMLGAQPRTPRGACLDGVRQADAMVLLLGSQYGAIQKSGLSPTHEEYREARETKPIFVFVDSRVSPMAEQAAFLQEVQDWGKGFFRGSFASPETLHRQVTRAIHQWELAHAKGPLDPKAMLERALELLPHRRGGSFGGAALTLAVAGGPLQAILRPSEIEDPRLAKDILREATSGDHVVLDHRKGTKFAIAEDALVMTQDESQSITLGVDGTIVLKMPVPKYSGGGVVLEEAVHEMLIESLRFTAWLLDRIDEAHRLTDVLIVAKLDGGILSWRTRAEHQASPNSYSIAMRDAPEPVKLTPAHRPRAVLRQKTTDIASDFLVLLRRQFKSG